MGVTFDLRTGIISFQAFPRFSGDAMSGASKSLLGNDAESRSSSCTHKIAVPKVVVGGRGDPPPRLMVFSFKQMDDALLDGGIAASISPANPDRTRQDPGDEDVVAISKAD